MKLSTQITVQLGNWINRSELMLYGVGWIKAAEALEAERDRYRTALEKIERDDPESYDASIARKALSAEPAETLAKGDGSAGGPEGTGHG